MKKLKLLLTLLLVAVGVNTWGQNGMPATLETIDNEASNFPLGTKWYRMRCFKANDADRMYLSVQSNGVRSATGVPAGETGYWCFVGNNSNGYSLYNRAEGPGKLLYYANNGNQSDVAQMTSATSTDGYRTFDFGAAGGNRANHYYLCIHGTGNNIINASTTGPVKLWNHNDAKSDDNSSWQFVEVGMEIAIRYKMGEELIATMQGVVAVGSTIQEAATRTMPNGYTFVDGATFATVKNGTFYYDVNVKALPPDYSVSSAAGGNSTHIDSGGRYTSQLKFDISNCRQVVNTNQTAPQQAVYNNRTEERIFAFKGAPIVAHHNMSGSWMHSYVYVDEDKNGFYVNEAIDIVHNVLRKDKNCDLRAFTYRNGYMSDGTPKTEQQAAGIKTLPSFNAPNTSGEYRVRFMVGWNDTNPKGSDNIASNGGLICDVTLVVADEYRITYKATDGTPIAGKAVVAPGLSVWESNRNRVAIGSTVTGFIGAEDFLVRDFVSATLNGTTYTSWEDVAASVQANDNVVVTLSDPYINTEKFYTIRHAGNTGNNMYDNGGSLKVQTKHADHKFVFKFEDAGDGKFYIQNIGTGRYVKRTQISGTSNPVVTLDAPVQAENCRYYVTNGLVPGHPEYYGIVDGDNVSNPIHDYLTRYYLHVNNSANVVAWETALTPDHNSQWYIEEVPIITLNFKIKREGEGEGEETIFEDLDTDGVEYTATSTGASTILPHGKVLSTFKGISFTNYAVEAYELDGQTYTTRTKFFEACHNLTRNANATLTLRGKAEGEVDVTIQLWKTKGTGYTNEDCNEGAWVWSAHDTNTNGDKVGKKAWKLNVSQGDKDIKGAAIPTGIDFKIVSNTSDTGVGGQIISGDAYKYGMTSDGANCICFASATGDGNTYEFSVADGYYILQYNLGLLPESNDTHHTFSNTGGATVSTLNPGTGQQRYTITDTPADQSCTFTAQSDNAEGVNSAANYFRVRIVNKAYLLNSMDRGVSICEDAMYDEKENKVGYPVSGERTAYDNLKTAIENFKGTENTGAEYENALLTNYTNMLKAYSKYISCTELNMPADGKVYTLSFVKSDATKVLINNGDEGLEIVRYNGENMSKPSARWISHKNADGKLVFVNKKDGKYLQADADGVRVSETYDTNGTTCFTVRATTQDMSDYMASATDEKLLGAVCMKNTEAYTETEGGETKIGTNKLTIQNLNNAFANPVQKEAHYDNDYSSAMRIEEVDGGETYNKIKFNEAGGKYYATYYGYPIIKPAGADMYYVVGTQNRTEEGSTATYLRLKKIYDVDVIKPSFAVILISSDVSQYDNNTAEMHIGEYTEAYKEIIDGMLNTEENLLKGTNVKTELPANKIIYVLSGKGGKAGFYPYQPSESYGNYLPMHKAYYEVKNEFGSPNEIRGFLFTTDDGQETCIDFVNGNVINSDDAIYDMSGRRVNKATQGVFIVNGKKVLM